MNKRKSAQKIRGWLPILNGELVHYQDGEQIFIWRYRNTLEKIYPRKNGYSCALVELKKISQ